MAPQFGVEVSPINVRDPGEIERAVADFARSPNSALIVTRSGLALGQSQADHYAGGPAQAARGLFEGHFVTSGGLISYGPDFATNSDAQLLR